MKQTFHLLLVTLLTTQLSCSKIEPSVPAPLQELPENVVNNNSYFMQFTAGGVVNRWESQVNGVANYTDKQFLGMCSKGSKYQYASNFAHIADTNYMKAFTFYTSICHADSGTAFLDSTYYKGEFPVQIDYGDSINSFSFTFLDSDTVLWQSDLAPNNFSAQSQHMVRIDTVGICYDGSAALEVGGTFSGWLYNLNGDSIALTNGSFFTKAVSY